MLVDVNDKLELKDLDLYIAKPNGEIIGHVIEAQNKQYSPKMGNLSELTFKVPYFKERNNKLVANNNIEKLKDRYLIKATYDGKVEWFRIDKNDLTSDDTGESKNIHAFSLGTELGDKIMRIVEETSKDITYMLDFCLSDTGWNVGYVDSGLLGLFRQFDLTETTKLNLLFEIAETYKGIVVWDTVNRKINIKAQDNVGADNGLKISYGKYMKTLNKDSDSNEMVTRLYPYGNENLDIRNVSITGMDYIDDFSYFMYPFHRVKEIKKDKIKSATVDYFTTGNIEKVLNDIELMNVNTLTIPIVVDFVDGNDHNMSINSKSREDAVALIQAVRDEVDNIILEPYPLVANGNISETEINPTDINSFFWNWKTVILEDVINIANEYNLYGLYISSNMVGVEYAEGYWKDLIAYVKANYKGNVIYRTNFWTTATWSQETIDAYNAKLNNTLFADVDIISISAYFELNEDKVSTVTQLEADLHSTRKFDRGQNVYQEVKNFYDKYKKPIIFGELGFASRESASSEPWNNIPSSVESETVQANLFKAYQNVFEKEPWFLGFSVFSLTSITDSTYSVIGKKAEAVVHDWYNSYKTVKSSDYMTDSLCHAILDYNILLKSQQGEFEKLMKVRESLNADLLEEQNELVTLNVELKKVQDSIDTQLAKSETEEAKPHQDKETLILSQISAKEIEIVAIADKIKKNQDSMDVIKAGFNANILFTNSQLIELNRYIIQKSWSDDNIVDAKDLLKEAKKAFKEMRKPKTEFTIDIVNFTQILESEKDWGKLNIGDTIYIHHEILGENLTAKITEFSIEFEQQSVSLTIANTQDILSDEDKFYERLYEASNAATSISMNKHKWNAVGETVSEIGRLIENGYDATKNRIVAGVKESVVIDHRGMTITNPDYPENILVAQAGVIAISNDNRKSWKHAITTEGIIGERIFGRLLAGERLIIDASNSYGKNIFTVDGNGVTIDGGSLSITGGINKSHLDPVYTNGLIETDTNYSNGIRIDSTNGIVVTRSDDKVKSILNANDGIKIVKNTGTTSSPTWEDVFYADLKGNIVANNLITRRISIRDRDDNTIIDADTGTIDFSRFPIKKGLLDETNIPSLSADKITAGTIDAKIVNVKNISATEIKTGTLNADLINITNLAVGKNVTMSPTASISWGQISNPPTAAQLGGVTTNDRRFTHIDQNGIYTGTLSADSIVSGSISADLINGGTITGTAFQSASSPDSYGRYQTMTLDNGSLDVTRYGNGTAVIRSTRYTAEGIDTWSNNYGTFNINDSTSISGSLSVSSYLSVSGRITASSLYLDGSINIGYMLYMGTTSIWNDSTRFKMEKGDGAIWIGSEGNIYFRDRGINKHVFYYTGTKEGGSIEINGTTYGMSPIDSPQTLIYDLITDIYLNGGESKIYLDSLFAKTICNYALFSNNNTVKIIEKTPEYFVVSGEGLTDFQVLGNRIGHETKYFTNLSEMSEEMNEKNFEGEIIKL